MCISGVDAVSNIDLSVERILQYMKVAIISMYLHYKPIPEVPLLPNIHIDHAYLMIC